MKRRVHRFLWLAFAAIGVAILISLPVIWGDLVYPLKYQDLILQESKEFNVPPTLIAGVIYTESHFNPDATSPIGARGLMQIMPATAAGIAARLSDTSYTADKLFDPATNIRYGTYYLRNLLDRFNNDTDVILVAYNGGAAAANRYQVSHDASIPLETSAYVVKVKRARDAYAQLYGEDLGTNIGDRLKQAPPQTLWDKLFGWLFAPPA